jgi:hypothetical protein
MNRYVVTDTLGRTFNVRFNNLDQGGALGNGASWSRDGVLAKKHYAEFVVAEDGTRINVAHIVTISPYGIPVPKAERVTRRIPKAMPILAPDMPSPVMPQSN